MNGASLMRGAFAGFCALLVWQVVVLFFAPPAFILPGPIAVLMKLWQARDLLTHHAFVTLGEIGVGIILGVTLGVATALAMALSKTLRNLFHPLLVFSQIIPVFALAPLLTLWLGYGFWPKVIMAIIIIFFPVTSAFHDGLSRTRQEWLDLAQNAGAKPLQSLLHLRVPAAVPDFMNGLRLALIYAPVGAVIGEWVGASQGLGYLMLFANGRAQADLMFAALLLLTLMTLLLYALIMNLAQRVLRRFLIT